MTAFMAPNGWTESLAAIYRVEAGPFVKLLWPEGISRCGKPCPSSCNASKSTGRVDARAFFRCQHTAGIPQQAATALGEDHSAGDG